MVHVHRRGLAKCGHLPDRLMEEFLENRRSGECTTRTVGYYETRLEEQLRRHDRQGGNAGLGVTSVRFRVDVYRRVRRLRRALWSVFEGRVSA